jgi:glycosyltransferase involved in cell wall biosynthesis
MKISVALCTFNGEKYITKQLDSILNQKDYNVEEIIVCDDNSTDRTIEILNDYLNKNPETFKIHRNEINLGSNKNFEKAISKCTGDFIFLSDQDDIWRNDKIQKTFAIFEQNPNAEGVFSNADLINDQDHKITPLTIWDTVFFLEKELPKPIDFFDIITKNGNVVTGATLCIKKSVKDYIFPFSQDIFHDEKIAIELALRNTLFYSTENLLSYRIHDKQQVGMKNMHQLEQKNRLKRIALGLEEPLKFNEYRHLVKKQFLKIQKIKKIENQTNTTLDLKQLYLKSHKEWQKTKEKKRAHFQIRYLFVQLFDDVLGKRKI